MRFLNLMQQTKTMQDLTKLMATHKQISLVGINEDYKPYVAAAVIQQQANATIFLLKNNSQLRKYKKIIKELLPEIPCFELLPEDELDFLAENANTELNWARLQALEHMAQAKASVIYLNMETYLHKFVAKQNLQQRQLAIICGQEISRAELLANLVDYGYSRTDKVYATGEFSLRGDILDVFPLGYDNPVRLEFYMENVDDIRAFDIASQRSIEHLPTLNLLPLLNRERNFTSDIFAYLEQNVLIIDEPTELMTLAAEYLQSLEENECKQYITYAELQEKQKNIRSISLVFEHSRAGGISQDVSNFLNVSSYHKKIDILIKDIKNYLQEQYSVIIVLSNLAKAKVFRQNFKNEFNVVILEETSVGALQSGVYCIVDNIQEGFCLKEEKLVVISEKDIYGLVKERKFQTIDKESKINYFTDIKIGDYVVHNIHGIGKYIGVDIIKVEGLLRDYLILQYAGTDKLFVPVEQVTTLHKYIGNDGVTPKLSKMGGTEWKRLKNKAKLAITDMAEELLRLYARRKLVPGFAFPEDDSFQNEFEEAFVYEETPDQLRAIVEIKKDMQSTQPMDRLLCGDVGYGKTEVAMRAVFKAVAASKQVAVLVPTTVLARQHLQTFSERMSAFGVRVEGLSRFNNAKEQKNIIQQLAEGKIDVIIATHRILQNDILFKNLGLLVIDEEQRFGVAQKEKVKKIATNVDVLTLSATPIPRTLHMTLLTAKDMSVIETAPENKMSVETYVMGETEAILEQAIKRELKRGGQVYYVVRFIEDIEGAAKKLKKILPKANIKIAHGRLPEGMLEKNIIAFYEGNCDILLSTSIIENGIDVPTANTIIIQDADKFGLSQLYQMRGRVGRGAHLAYAYLLYRPQKSLSEIAQKRLEAIRSFTELGSGFKIAMRDLEIRGAGSILGDKQHGHVLSIGFQAYCQLLEETIAALKGETVAITNNFEPNIDIAVNLHISPEYMPDNSDKLELYKSLAIIKDAKEAQELLDELIDRFGEPPKDVIAMIRVAKLRAVCRNYGLRSIIAKGKELSIVFNQQTSVQGAEILKLSDIYSKKMKFIQGEYARLQIKLGENIIDYLDLTEKIIKILLPNIK